MGLSVRPRQAWFDYQYFTNEKASMRFDNAQNVL